MLEAILSVVMLCKFMSFDWKKGGYKLRMPDSWLYYRYARKTIQRDFLTI